MGKTRLAGRSVGVGLALFLAGCAAPAVISDINDSALKVQGNKLTPEKEFRREARKGCRLYGKKPVAISTRCLDQYCNRQERLFACK